MTAFILYENADWLPPLTDALTAAGVPHEAVFVDGGALDLAEPPPEGVFINRMSPSSHTRGHQDGVRFMQEYLSHLEAHGRRVINGSRAFELEVSKVKQDVALRRHGILTPRTLCVVGRERLVSAAASMPAPFITKHNQGGKGLGIQLFRTHESFAAHVEGGALVDDPGGVFVLQEYIEPPEPFITRIEIVDGVFQYAIASNTEGGFQLCPADFCQADDQFCPAGPTSKFRLRPEITSDDMLVRKLIAFMRSHALDVAGIEFVEDRDGRRYVYDINGTTNYNSDVERAHGFSGMGAIAAFAKRLLRSATADQSAIHGRASN
jgi:glutathione synthase/RimK-type ligase-like ATP-grasp enzyme